MPIMRATMQAVADRARVSRATVSLALRDDPRIPEETRARVRAAAEALDYRANPLVSALMAQVHARRPQGASPVLAILMHEKPGAREERGAREVFAAFFRGAAARAKELGYRTEFFSLHPEHNSPRRLLRILRTRGVQGVLVAPVSEPRELDLPLEGLSAATIGYSIQTPLHRATPHHAEGMMLACEVLRKKGFRRIGFAMSQEIERRLRFRYRSAYLGFFSVEQGAKPLRIWDVNGWHADSFHRWLETEKPEAVILHQPHIRAWMQEKYRLPEDFSVVELGTTADSMWSGIDQRHPEVGAAAIDLIVGQLHRNERGLPEVPKTVMIEGVWREGRTAPALGGSRAAR